MIVALTGTPGIGKTSVSDILKKNHYFIVDLNQLITEKGFISEFDEKRKSNIVDLNKLDDYIKKLFSKKDFVIIEGHLSHLLGCIDKIIILRCHPFELKKRLLNKNWNYDKINENVEAEILDIILCEAVDIHGKENIYEIDTTGLTIVDVYKIILEIIEYKFTSINKYKIGCIDWSENIFKDF